MLGERIPHRLALGAEIAALAAGLLAMRAISGASHDDLQVLLFYHYGHAFWFGTPPFHTLPVEYPPLSLALFSLSVLPPLPDPIMAVNVYTAWMAVPYRLRLLPSGDSKYFTIKTRALSAKDIQQEHCVNSKALFNLDTVSCLEPVYVVEGEPDVAVMEEAGFRTVSVMNANHDKFDKAQLDILCEAPHVYLMGDQPQRGLDDPGTHCMDALERQLPVGKVSRIRGTGAKDACELARQWQDGFAARVSELSEDARVPWVSKNIGNVTGLLSLPEPNWVVDRMLPYGCVSILCSPQGGQKTTVCPCTIARSYQPHSLRFQIPWP